MFKMLRKRKVLSIHKELGYPPFKKEEQCEMLLNYNFSLIANLTEYKECPDELLKYYININRVELAEYLLNSNYLKDSFISEPNTSDGIWVMKNNSGYLVFEYERGKGKQTQFKTINDVALYFSDIHFRYLKFRALYPK